MKRLPFLTAMLGATLVLAAAGCVSQRVECPAPPRADAEAAALLTGSFSSAAQAEGDPENYRDIRLHAVRIWTARDPAEGVWIYVEQAAASALDRPYRQRVYRVESLTDSVQTPWGASMLVSHVYEFEEPLRFAGMWSTPERFDELLSPDNLTMREGCSVHLVAAAADIDRAKDGVVFIGGTLGADCSSTLAGASYATSEVRIYEDRLETWDRGFDADGNQVWGATEGPYIFMRVEGDASHH